MRRQWRARPGDRVVHRPRREEMGPVRVTLPAPRGPQRARVSYWTLAAGFAVLILAGTLLLLLPWATAEATFTPFLDALFTATSAVTVTGLVVVDTGSHWTPYGKVVIGVLIFLGGLGIMTSATVLFVLIGRRITLSNRLLLQESLGAPRPGGVVRLARNIALTAIVIQVVGILVLWGLFARPGSDVRDDPLTHTGYALFHGVSSFNNAGFDIFPDTPEGLGSVAAFAHDVPFLLVTIVLTFLGAISYTVMRDVWDHRLRFHRYWLDTKLVLLTSGVLLVLGALVIFVLEFGNDQTMGEFSIGEKLLNSSFFSVISRTTGFSTVDVGQMKTETSFFMTGLMFIGGASASTAGGIKVNTLAVLLVAVLSSLRGRVHPSAFSRGISALQVYRALVVVVAAGLVVFFTAILLTITEESPFIETFFETVSAFGTVGLSTGLTSELSSVGQVIVVLAMFLGRLGPLTLALALAQQEERALYKYGEERVKIG